MQLTAILSPYPDGTYVVVVPALPGCVCEGNGVEGALANAADAMASWLAEARAAGRAPLEETAELIADEVYQVLADREEDGLPPTIETRQIEVPAPA
jgi:predicted RNase H-like HicB family nuclease